jgi:hypothetical protein
LFAALAGETEANLVSLDGDVPVLQGRKAKTVILPRVVVISHADQRGFEEMHNCCQHFLPTQPAQSHVLTHFLPNGRKRIRECHNMLVFRAFPDLAKACVIAVLLPALGVPAGRLDVAV